MEQPKFESLAEASLLLVDCLEREGSQKSLFNAKTQRGVLHRAFSVFLFDESTGELLLQQSHTCLDVRLLFEKMLLHGQASLEITLESVFTGLAFNNLKRRFGEG